MLLSLENSVDFLQCFSFCFYPVDILAKLASYSLLLFYHCKRNTYNQEKCDDVPRPVDNVRLPCDFCQRNGHDKCEKQTEAKEISLVSHC